MGCGTTADDDNQESAGSQLVAQETTNLRSVASAGLEAERIDAARGADGDVALIEWRRVCHREAADAQRESQDLEVLQTATRLDVTITVTLQRAAVQLDAVSCTLGGDRL